MRIPLYSVDENLLTSNTPCVDEKLKVHPKAPEKPLLDGNVSCAKTRKGLNKMKIY